MTNVINYEDYILEALSGEIRGITPFGDSDEATSNVSEDRLLSLFSDVE